MGGVGEEVRRKALGRRYVRARVWRSCQGSARTPRDERAKGGQTYFGGTIRDGPVNGEPATAVVVVALPKTRAR